MAIETGQMLRFFLSPADGSHIAYPHNLTIEGGDINRPDLVEGLESAARLDIETTIPGVDRTDWRFGPSPAQGVSHRGGR